MVLTQFVLADVRVPAVAASVWAEPLDSGALVSFEVDTDSDDYDAAGFGARRFVISLGTGVVAGWGDLTVACSPAYITGTLTNGAAYSFGVAVINELGESAGTVVSNTVTAGAPQSPAPVLGLPRLGAVLVSWAASVPNAAAVSQYTVATTHVDTNTPLSDVAVSEGPALIEGLTNFEAYMFSVTATNSFGTSPPATVPTAVYPQEFSNDLLVKAGETYTLTQNVNEHGSVTIEAGGTVVFTSQSQSITAGVVTVHGTIQGTYITISCYSLAVHGGGAVTTDGKAPNNGPGNGSKHSYGGVHANDVPSNSKSPYGSLVQPTSVGSHSHYQFNFAGGAVRVVAIASIDVAANGRISSDAIYTHSGAGGGSGGSVWLDCATLSGAGRISANGGRGVESGSGGRVSVTAASSSSFAGTLEAATYASSYMDEASEGTVFANLPGQVTQSSDAVLLPAGAVFTQLVLPGDPSYTQVTLGEGAVFGVVSGSSFTTAALTLAASARLHITSLPLSDPPHTLIAVTGGAIGLAADASITSTANAPVTITSPQPLEVPSGSGSGGLRLGGSTTIVVPSAALRNPSSIVFAGGTLNVTCTSGGLEVEAGCAISGPNASPDAVAHLDVATSVRLVGTVSASNVRVQAQSMHLASANARVHADGLGSTNLGLPNSYKIGCSHGNVADSSDWGSAASSEHGDPLAPVDHGCSRSNNHGGGAVRLVIAGELRLDEGAAVSASEIKFSGGTWNSGGGAGGSVWITAGALTGTGRIDADATSTINHGVKQLYTPGTGGRVAVYVTGASATAFGGTVSATGSFKADTHRRVQGTVILDIPGHVSLLREPRELRVPAGASYQHLYVPGSSNSSDVAAAFDVVDIAAGALASLQAPAVSVGSLAVAATGTLRCLPARTDADTTVQFEVASASLAGKLEPQDVSLALTTSAALTVTGSIVGVRSASLKPPVDVSVSAPALEISSSAKITAERATTIESVASLLIETGASLGATLIATSSVTINQPTASLVVKGTIYAAAVHITAASLALAEFGASVHADGRGNEQAGKASHVRWGCSHGNKVWPPTLNPGAAGEPYGDPFQPTAQGCAPQTNWAGGTVRVIVGTLDMGPSNARISANAASPVWNQGGSSGGSVWITTGTLTGEGHFQAGGHTVNSNHKTGFGGGSGGRVAVYVTASADGFTGSITANRGSGSTKSTQGTVYFEVPGYLGRDLDVLRVKSGWTIGSYVLDESKYTGLGLATHGGATIDSLHVEAGATFGLFARHGVTMQSLTVQGGGVLSSVFIPEHAETFVWHVTDTLSVAGQLNGAAYYQHVGFRFDTTSLLTGGSVTVVGALGIAATVLTVSGPTTITADSMTLDMSTFTCVTTPEGTPTVTVSSVLTAVASSATIGCVVKARDVDWTSDSLVVSNVLSTSGMSYDAALGVENSQYKGAPHGGMAPWNLALPYGSVVRPNARGSSANTHQSRGGGIIHIKAGHMEVQSGAFVEANGWTAQCVGGSSGGSILIECDTIAGSGTVSAQGMARAGNCNNVEQSAGAGGRIAVHAATSTFTGTFKVNGGYESKYYFRAGPGTIYTQVGATKKVLVASATGSSTHSAGIVEPMPEIVDELKVQDAPLLIGAAARVATRSVAGTSTIHVDSVQGLVVYNAVCSGIASTITLTGHKPLVFTLDDGAPLTGSFASGTTISGTMNADWSQAFCRFGDGALIVDAELIVAAVSDDACGSTMLWSCAVPPNPDELGIVEVSFSVDRNLFHAFDPPHIFRFTAASTCTVLTPTPTFPAGCTLAMLGDTVCDAACNTRNCASDNRDCEAPPVYVSTSGDDNADGTQGSPVQSLELAIRMACSGFASCLPIKLLPGTHDCGAAVIERSASVLTIEASSDAGAAQPAVITCSNANAGMAFNATHLVLRRIDLRSRLVLSGSSLLELEDVVVGMGASVLLEDSLLVGTRVTAAGGTVAVDYSTTRAAPFIQVSTANGWLCPACSKVAASGPLVELSRTRVAVIDAGEYGADRVGTVVGSLWRLEVPAVAGSNAMSATLLSSGEVAQLRHAVVSNMIAHTNATVDAGAMVLQHLTCLQPFELSVAAAPGATLVATIVELRGSEGGVALTGSVMAARSASSSDAARVALEGRACRFGDALVVPSASGTRALMSTDGAMDVEWASVELQGSGAGVKLTSFGSPSAVSSFLATDSVFTGTSAPEGGAIWVQDTQLRLRNCTFHSNQALQLGGGAVYVTGAAASAEVVGCRFTANVAAGGGGGGVAVVGIGQLHMEGSSFTDNHGFGGGGAVQVVRSTATIHSLDCQKNVDSFGGCLFVRSSQVTVVGATIHANTAFNGANVHLRASNVAIHGSSIGHSSAYTAPGIKVWDVAQVLLNQTVVEHCESTTAGAALAVTAQSHVELLDCTLQHNQGPSGTALLLSETSSANLTRTEVAHNNATAGAALELSQLSSLGMTACSVHDNRVEAPAAMGTVTVAPAGLQCSGQSTMTVDKATTFSRHHPYTFVCEDGCSVAADTDTALAHLSCDVSLTVGVASVSEAVLPTVGGANTITLTAAVPDTAAAVRTYVGGVECGNSGLSDATTALVQVPPGTGREWPIQVLVEGVRGVAHSTVPFDYAPPAPTSIEPRFVAATGATVTVRGSNFGPPGGWDGTAGDAITINGVVCGSAQRLGHDTLTCEAAPGVGVDLPVSVQVAAQLQSTALLKLTMANTPGAPEFTAVEATEVADTVPSALRVDVVAQASGGVPVASYAITHTVTGECAFGAGRDLSGQPECATGFNATLHTPTASGDGILLPDLCTGCTYQLQATVTNVAQMVSPASEAHVVLVAAKPVQPLLTDTRVGDAWPTSMFVDVTPASDGGSPITSYVLSWSKQASFTPEAGTLAVAVADATPLGGNDGAVALHLPGLEAHQEYYVRVRAVNAKGSSTYSTPRASAVLIGLPSAPLIHSATFVGTSADDATVRLALSEPGENGGRPLHSYRALVYQVTDVALYEASGVVAGAVASVDEPTQFVNLQAKAGVGLQLQLDVGPLPLGYWYGIVVEASNVFASTTYGDPSAPSRAVRAAMPPTAPFVAPEDVRALSFTANATEVSVAWTASDARGAPLQAYHVTAWSVVSPSELRWSQWRNLSVADAALAEPQLNTTLRVPFWDDAQYARGVVVEVVAWNELGASAASRAVAAQLPCKTGFGTMSTSGDTCQLCPAGMSVVAGQDAGIAGQPCTDCPAGRAAAERGATSCQACPVGEYQPRGGQSSCLTVPRGGVTATAASVAFVLCDEGTAPLPNKTACEACLPGWASNGRDVCAICPSGRYESGGSSCVPCPRGHFSATPGASGACDRCDPGRVGALQTGSSTCVPCSATGLIPNAFGDACEACGPGAVAALGDSECSACDPGQQPNDGASRCEDCPAGRAGSSGSSCEACEPGKYSADPGMDGCDPCPVGRWTALPGQQECPWADAGYIAAAPGSTTQAPCTKGHYQAADHASCEECPVGRYQHQAAQATCITVSPGHVARSRASFEEEACSPGTVAVNGTRCEACEPGRVAPAASTGPCTACGAGRYESGNAVCEPCPKGHYSATPGASGACEACAPGTISITEVGAASCVPCPTTGAVPNAFGDACEACPTGAVAALRASTCTICDAGWRPNSGRSVCERCAAGRAGASGAQCDACEPGKYAAEPGMEACATCPAGRVSLTAAAMGCEECGGGMRQVGNTCERCPVGRFSSTLGRHEPCELCPVGRWNDREGQQACAKPDSGYVAKSPGATTQTPCGKGMYQAPDATACLECPAGTYQDQVAQSGCKPVTPGFVAATNASIAQEPCNGGSIAVGGVACQLCPVGWTSPPASVGPCTICPAGTWAAEDRSACTPCDKGRYSAEPGSTQCLKCDPGYVSEQVGESQCRPCGAGQRAVSDGKECELCSDGTFGVGGVECLKCPTEGVTCNKGVLGFKEGFWSPDLALLAEASQAGVSFNISEVTLTATVDTGAVKFHKCQPGACIQSANGTLTCAARRTGPLCAICEAGYVHSGADCVKCEESSGWNWFFLIIMLTIVFVSVVVLVRRATRANASTDWKHLTKEQRRARLLVPTLKVTISYLQVISFMSDFAVPWPPATAAMWEVAGSSSALPVNSGFVSCTISWDLYWRFRAAAASPILFVVLIASIPVYQRFCAGRCKRVTIPTAAAQAQSRERRDASRKRALQQFAANTALSPGAGRKQAGGRRTRAVMGGSGRRATFAQGAGESMRMSVRALEMQNGTARRKQKASWSMFRTSVLVVWYLIYPTVAREAVRLLNCSVELDGTQYLKADYRVQCYTVQHNLHAIVAILVIILFCMGLPLISFVAVWQEHRRNRRLAELADRVQITGLAKQKTQKATLAFLTDGYNKKFYWWESVVMLRKFMLVAVAVLFNDSDSGLQIFAGIGVVVLFLVFQLMAQPFASQTQDRLETGAQCAASASLYCGWLLSLSLNGTLDLLVGIFVIVINCVLAAFCIYVLFRGLGAALRYKAAQIIAKHRRGSGERPAKTSTRSLPGGRRAPVLVGRSPGMPRGGAATTSQVALVTARSRQELGGRPATPVRGPGVAPPRSTPGQIRGASADTERDGASAAAAAAVAAVGAITTEEMLPWNGNPMYRTPTERWQAAVEAAGPVVRHVGGGGGGAGAMQGSAGWRSNPLTRASRDVLALSRARTARGGRTRLSKMAFSAAMHGESALEGVSSAKKKAVAALRRPTSTEG